MQLFGAVSMAFLAVAHGAGQTEPLRPDEEGQPRMPDEGFEPRMPEADAIPVVSVPRNQVESWADLHCTAGMHGASVSMSLFVDEDTIFNSDHPQLPWGGTHVGLKGRAELNIKIKKAFSGVPTLTCDLVAVDEVRGTAIVKIEFSGIVHKTQKVVTGRAFDLQVWNVATGKLKSTTWTYKNYDTDVLPAFLTDAEMLFRKIAIVRQRATNVTQLFGDIESPDVTEGIMWQYISPDIKMLVDISPALFSKQHYRGYIGIKEISREMMAFLPNVSFKTIISHLMGRHVEVIFAEDDDVIIKVCSGLNKVQGCLLIQYKFDVPAGLLIEVQVMSLSSPEIWDVLQGPMNPMSLFRKLVDGSHTCGEMAMCQPHEPDMSDIYGVRQTGTNVDFEG